MKSVQNHWILLVYSDIMLIMFNICIYCNVPGGLPWSIQIYNILYKVVRTSQGYEKPFKMACSGFLAHLQLCCICSYLHDCVHLKYCCLFRRMYTIACIQSNAHFPSQAQMSRMSKSPVVTVVIGCGVAQPMTAHDPETVAYIYIYIYRL